MIDDTQEGMTPQQVRLFHLQASRNWGPFTDTESAHLNTTFTRKKSRPSDVQRADVSSLIVVREIIHTDFDMRFVDWESRTQGGIGVSRFGTERIVPKLIEKEQRTSAA
jgi:hypothetical protein